ELSVLAEQAARRGQLLDGRDRDLPARQLLAEIPELVHRGRIVEDEHQIGLAKARTFALDRALPSAAGDRRSLAGSEREREADAAEQPELKSETSPIVPKLHRVDQRTTGGDWRSSQHPSMATHPANPQAAHVRVLGH